MAEVTYDPKCHELAEHFLKDATAPGEEVKKQDVEELAKTIQFCIEEWLNDWEDEA
jgi:hypothetical protein